MNHHVISSQITRERKTCGEKRKANLLVNECKGDVVISAASEVEEQFAEEAADVADDDKESSDAEVVAGNDGDSDSDDEDELKDKSFELRLEDKIDPMYRRKTLTNAYYPHFEEWIEHLADKSILTGGSDMAWKFVGKWIRESGFHHNFPDGMIHLRLDDLPEDLWGIGLVRQVWSKVQQLVKRQEVAGEDRKNDGEETISEEMESPMGLTAENMARKQSQHTIKMFNKRK